MKQVLYPLLLAASASAAFTEKGCECLPSSEVIFTMHGQRMGGGFSHNGCGTGPYEQQSPAKGRPWCDTKPGTGCREGWDFCNPNQPAAVNPARFPAKPASGNRPVSDAMAVQVITQSGAQIDSPRLPKSSAKTAGGCTCQPFSEVILVEDGHRIGGGLSHQGCGTGKYEQHSPGRGQPWCDVVESWCNGGQGWDFCTPDRNSDQNQGSNSGFDQQQQQQQPKPQGGRNGGSYGGRYGGGYYGGRYGGGSYSYGGQHGGHYGPHGLLDDIRGHRHHGSSRGRPSSDPYGSSRGRPSNDPYGSSRGRPSNDPYGSSRGRPSSDPYGYGTSGSNNYPPHRPPSRQPTNGPPQRPPSGSSYPPPSSYGGGDGYGDPYAYGYREEPRGGLDPMALMFLTGGLGDIGSFGDPDSLLPLMLLSGGGRGGGGGINPLFLMMSSGLLGASAVRVEEAGPDFAPRTGETTNLQRFVMLPASSSDSSSDDSDDSADQVEDLP